MARTESSSDRRVIGSGTLLASPGRRVPWWVCLLVLLALIGVALIVWALTRDTDADRHTTSRSVATPVAPSAGTVSAAGTSLLPVPTGTGLTGVAGQPVVADRMVVRAVVAGEGFWIGTSDHDQLFVDVDLPGYDNPGTQTRPSAAQPGQRVAFTGVVKALDKAPAEEDITDPVGAALLQREAGYLEIITSPPQQV